MNIQRRIKAVLSKQPPEREVALRELAKSLMFESSGADRRAEIQTKAMCVVIAQRGGVSSE